MAEIAGHKPRGVEARRMLAYAWWSSVVLQAQPELTGGGLLAALGTVLVGWVFYAVTLHLAATFFIGDVPTQPAATAGVVPAVVMVLLSGYVSWEASLVSQDVDVALVLVAVLFADALAIAYAYDLSWRPTAALTGLHLAFSVVLGFALYNLAVLL